jgi:hypothetical protein
METYHIVLDLNYRFKLRKKLVDPTEYWIKDIVAKNRAKAQAICDRFSKNLNI